MSLSDAIAPAPADLPGGETGRLIHAFDWPSAGLPAYVDWPPHLRMASDLVLRSPAPLALFWGPRGVMIYNDAYVAVAGGRHPALLGASVLEGWPEIADFVAGVMADVLSGRSVSFDERPFNLYRNERPEACWFDLHFSPVGDENGTPAGVLAVVLETTGRVRMAERLEDEREAVAGLNRRLAAERDGLRRLFQRAPGFMAVLRGPDHVFEMANEAYLSLVGHRDLFGKPVRDALPELVGQGFFDLLDRVFASGQPYVGAGLGAVLRRSAGAEEEVRFVDFVYQPVRSDSGAVEGIFVQGHDVTERHLAFAALAESEERFRLIADSAPVPMWVSELGGKRRFVNKAYLAFLGVGFEQALTFDWRTLLHPEDVDRVVQESVAGEASLKPFSLEGRYRRADGQVRWLRSESQPRWDERGAHAGFVGVAYDVTEERVAAEHQRLLINELNHRVKNSLATVQSLAAQSLRPGVDPDEARRRFERRLLALAKAHDVLTQRNWEGAELGQVIAEALRPYRDGGEDRIDLSGPAVTLPPQAALAFSMTLHELATNAAKYGALSTAEGRVEVVWETSAASPPLQLTLTWRERGGPPVSPPKRRGFGTRLIERQLAHELGGSGRFDFAPGGLVCILTAPILPSATVHLDTVAG